MESTRLLLFFSFTLFLAASCPGQSAFEIAFQERSRSNPPDLKLELRTKGGRLEFHLFEPIPIELRFSSSSTSKYLIELDETMNFAGQSNRFLVSPTETVFLASPAAEGRGVVCCDFDRRYLSTKPLVLGRELTDYLRFEKSGTYSVYVVTQRVFKGIQKADVDPSPLVLVSNLLRITILPDDADWDSRQLESVLRKLRDPRLQARHTAALKHAESLRSETARDFALENIVPQTEFASAQKALNVLDTDESIRERVESMQMEAKEELEISRKFDTEPILHQPSLGSTTRPDVVVAFMKQRAQLAEFGVDYNFVYWWSRFVVQRDHPEMFRPTGGRSTQEQIDAYRTCELTAKRGIIRILEAALALKQDGAAEVTSNTIRLVKSELDLPNLKEKSNR